MSHRHQAGREGRDGYRPENDQCTEQDQADQLLRDHGLRIAHEPSRAVRDGAPAYAIRSQDNPTLRQGRLIASDVTVNVET